MRACCSRARIVNFAQLARHCYFNRVIRIILIKLAPRVALGQTNDRIAVILRAECANSGVFAGN